MGYELHIARPEDWSVVNEDSASDDWSLEDSNAISSEEWVTLARSDDRLIEFGQDDLGEAGPMPVYVWRDEGGPSFVWRDGQVDVKGVRSDGEIAEIVALARGLGADVLGDDGETYDRDGRPG